MLISQAVSLLKSDYFTTLSSPQTWADLGCGTGTFTQALAELLPPPSFIFAVDQNWNALQQLPAHHGNSTIYIRQADFLNNDLAFDKKLNGILMANALHYVKNKTILLNKLTQYLHPNGCFMIIEYETENANPWVPYPIRFQALSDLSIRNGYTLIEKIGELPSHYHGSMYAALVQR